MSEEQRIVTCKTVRYYADCLESKAFPDLIVYEVFLLNNRASSHT